jgi:hypothetical protein
MRTFFLLVPLALVGLTYPSSAQNRDRDRDRGPENHADRQYSPDQAVQTCKDSVQQEAHQRFGAAAVTFRQANIVRCALVQARSPLNLTARNHGQPGSTFPHPRLRPGISSPLQTQIL